MMQEENRKILAFSKQQESREEGRMATRKQQEEAMAAMQNRLAQDIKAKKEQAEEMQR